MRLRIVKVAKYNICALVLLVASLVTMASCGGKTDSTQAERVDSKQAKRMLQGVWLDRDDESVAFLAKGDSIFYPDSIDMPVRFAVYGDTLMLMGSTETGYCITKQSEHLFSFKNQNGDEVCLVKAEDAKQYMPFFEHRAVQPLNQGVRIDRDTVVVSGDKRYHCYVNVSPTTYKVIKRAYNDDGVEVDNTYYDNIVHLGVFEGNNRIYSHDFRKADFAGYLPAGTVEQCILNDITFRSANAKGLCFEAVVGIPDGVSNYVVELCVGKDGKVTMSNE